MANPDYKGLVLEIYEGWPDVCSVDGFDLQELGQKYGVLDKQQRVVPCATFCACLEVWPEGEEVDCYQLVTAQE